MSTSGLFSALPGLPARLEVSTRTEFPGEDTPGTKKIWQFCNKHQDPKSLISRVEVWQEAREGKIFSAILYLKGPDCGKIGREFADKINADFFYCQQFDWCQLTITDPKTMKVFFRWIDETQQFVGHSKPEMQFILSKL